MCVSCFFASSVDRTDRILQLVCVQTRSVQIYRITARDALPPPGALLDLDSSDVSGLDSSVVLIGDTSSGNVGGGNMGSDLPVPSVAVQAEMEEEQEQEQELDHERQRAEAEPVVSTDLEKEGGFDIGGADSVALSKGGTISSGERQTDGDGVAEGGESAPSFEKVRIFLVVVVLERGAVLS